MLSEPSPVFDARQYLAIVRRNLRVVVLVAVAAGALGVVVGTFGTVRYASTADLVPQPSVLDDIMRTVFESQALPPTVTPDDVQVFLDDHRSRRPAEMAGVETEVTLEPEENLIRLRVVADSAARARSLSETLADAFGDSRVELIESQLERMRRLLEGRLEELDRQAASPSAPDGGLPLGVIERRAVVSEAIEQIIFAQQIERTSDIRVVHSASEPDAVGRGGVSDLRLAVVATIVGVLLGIAVAIVREHSDFRVRGDLGEVVTPDGFHVPQASAVPLANWTKTRPGRPGPVVQTSGAPLSATAEGIASLRTWVRHQASQDDLSSFAVVSSYPREGRTSVALNLARELARSGSRVVLVDADFRNPGLAELFGGSPGLAEVVRGEAALPDVLRELPGVPGLRYLPSGVAVTPPSELLAHPETVDALSGLRRDHDFVVLDTPPLFGASDALVVATAVDLALLVAASGYTDRRDVERSIELLRSVGADRVATVVNGVRTSDGLRGSRGASTRIAVGTREAGGEPPGATGAAESRVTATPRAEPLPAPRAALDDGSAVPEDIR